MPTELGDFHQPQKLLDKHDFKTKYEQALNQIKIYGLPAEEACNIVWGVANKTFKNWVRWAYEDMEAGFDETESNLIKLMLGLAREDAKLHRRLTKRAFEVAEDGDTRMLQFLLKTRYGYSEKTKSEIEFSNNEEAPVKFEIVDMTPNEEE